LREAKIREAFRPVKGILYHLNRWNFHLLGVGQTAIKYIPIVQGIRMTLGG